ncbi:PREDICTED: uncharacterized protein LOC106816279 [Priapulus caudatus]|uniref:Uncharacterized protein LOC106816279 n=1 Tax=Priapulus caudatus TaxID=37621 RepID=A0ABM1EVX8_PRICU|nr:PREDICTED: uncharacterized protein LOC106816279 [Priapulus caudatus]
MATSGCGDVCSFRVRDRAPGRFYPLMRRNIQCPDVMRRMRQIAPGAFYPPPRFLPTSLMDEMTHHGQLPLRDVNFLPDNDRRPREGALVVSEQMLGELTERVWRGVPIMQGAPVGAEMTLRRVLRGHRRHLEGAVVFTLGQKNPWVEAILLAMNPRHVVSVEYQLPLHEIATEHAQISGRSPAAAAAEWTLAGDAGTYNVGVAFFTVGQLGLGRYGEQLNPWADFEAMAQAWCVTRTGGLFVLAVYYEQNDEYLVWNANRIYSAKLAQYLTANWEVVDVKRSDGELGVVQRPGWAMWVLKKP